jgi:hypothetical protein
LCPCINPNAQNYRCHNYKQTHASGKAKFAEPHQRPRVMEEESKKV